MWLGHHFQGQMVIGQLVADVLNSPHAGTGATWRINTKILSTCRGRRHIVAVSGTACIYCSGVHNAHQSIYVQVVCRYRNAQMNIPIIESIATNVYKQTPRVQFQSNFSQHSVSNIPLFRKDVNYYMYIFPPYLQKRSSAVSNFSHTSSSVIFWYKSKWFTSRKTCKYTTLWNMAKQNYG